jgi:hypothetical protein
MKHCGSGTFSPLLKENQTVSPTQVVPAHLFSLLIWTFVEDENIFEVYALLVSL